MDCQHVTFDRVLFSETEGEGRAVQSVSITTKVVSSNLVHGDLYSIQHYVISLSVTLTGQWFSPGIPVSSTNKTDCHDLTEILLKVALSTNPPTPL